MGSAIARMAREPQSMRKTLALLLCLASPGWPDASLHFTGGSSDKVTVNNSSSIQDLASGTVLGWFSLDSLSNSRFGFVSKTNATTPRGGWALQRVGADGTKFLWFNTQASVLPTARSVTGTLTTGWNYLGATWNDTTTNAAILYRGTQTAMASAPALDIATTGAGPLPTDSGITLRLSQIENDATGRSNDGNISWVGIWNRPLSLSEIQDQQFNPHITSGCVFFMYVGFAGTGTQRDLSGNGNSGTVTGTTVSAIGAPIAIGGSPL